jgi:3-hydroxybutyryl-CoA dehydrogenase
MDNRARFLHRPPMTEAKEKIGVVGAGLMGAEIALVHALAGHDVLLSDRTDEYLAAALARLKDILEKGVPRGFWEAASVEPALARIAVSPDLQRFADRDVVIEAVFENEGVKAEIFKTLDRVCGPTALFATNTSSIAISTLASYVAPARRPLFLGTHYFSPVSRMKLVEIIPAFETSEAAVATATRLAKGAGKTPIRVKDVVGFAVNRVLSAFLIEAVKLVEEGVATPADIDLACRLGLGHPMGPFELMDAVSSSLALEVQEILFDAYGERFRPPALMKQVVKAGRIGRKAGKGWRI